MISFEWITLHRQLATSHVGWFLMCAVFRTRRLRHCANTHDGYFSYTLADTRTHSKTQLLGLQRPICLEHTCQCSIKNPSDKRFKWLPLWVMSSCISEEAFTAQQMKTDEKDHPLRIDIGYIRASVALMQMHLRLLHYFHISRKSVQSKHFFMVYYY